jgi:quinol monooxygenase YgiN
MAIRPEMVEEARSAAIQMVEASRAEPGCNEYGFTPASPRTLADPRVLVLTDEWASEEALQAHLATPSFAAFAELLARVIAAPPDFRRFDAQDARPLFG